MLNMLVATIVLISGAEFTVTEVPGPDGMTMYRTSAALVLVGMDFEGERAFVNSAGAVRKTLTDEWKFPHENVRVRPVRTVEDARRELKWLEANTTDEDRVVVTYIAHGVEGAKGPELDLGLGTGRYRMDDASADFAKVKARHKLLILDACRSGDASAGPAAGLVTHAPDARARRSSAVLLTSDPGRDARVGASHTRFVEALVREVNRATAQARSRGVWLSDVIPGEGLGFARLGTAEHAESSQMLLDPSPTDKTLESAGQRFRQFDPKEEAERKGQIVALRRELRRDQVSTGVRAVLQMMLAKALSYEPEPSRRRESLQEAVETLEDVRFLPSEYLNDLSAALAMSQTWLGELAGDAGLLEAAVAEWKSLSSTYSRGDEPQKWAWSMNGLGVSLPKLGAFRGHIGLLESSAAAYRSTLEVYSRTANPTDWAKSQNNLGVSLSGLGRLSANAQHFSEAIAAFQLALQIYKKGVTPSDWAMTQRNLGKAQRMLGNTRGDTQLIQDSLTSLRSVLDVYSRKTMPAEWATTQGDIANSLTDLGEANRDFDLLELAAVGFRSSLEVYSPEQSPADWVSTQINLGNVLLASGQLKQDPQLLTDAIGAYRSALEVATKSGMPADWGMAQNNLGAALAQLGNLEKDADALADSFEALQLALEVHTKTDSPRNWAMTRFNMGEVGRFLGTLKSDPKALEESAAAYRSALEIYTKRTHPPDWARTQNNLGATLSSLGEQKRDADILADAIAAYQLALEVITRESKLSDWSVIQTNLGVAYFRISQVRSRKPNLQRAIEHLRLAEQGYLQLRDQANVDRLKKGIELFEQLLKEGGSS